jgi:hypothetical protein
MNSDVTGAPIGTVGTRISETWESSPRYNSFIELFRKDVL